MSCDDVGTIVSLLQLEFMKRASHRSKQKICLLIIIPLAGLSVEGAMEKYTL